MMNSIKPTIIKAVTDYNSYVEMLSPVIERYFEDNFYDWQYFNGWVFSSNGESIVIKYSHEELWCNIDTYTEISFATVPLDEILDYYKNIENKLQK